MFFDLNYSNTDNAISNSSIVDALGRRVNQYINVQGNYSYRGYVYYGMDIYKGLQFGINMNGGFNRYVNRVNGIRNVNDNTNMSYGVNFSYWGDKAVNFYFNVNANDNRTVSSIRPGSETNYWTYQINGNTQIKLKKIKTFIDFNIEGNIYQKSKIFPDQRDVIIVSPSIRKVLGKTDSWEVKMYVFDMLNQNTNIQRNISSNFISESSNNGIRRYTMFSLIYNFSKNGKPSNMGF